MSVVRTAVWTVDKNLEVLPDATLFGGVQGEDKATRVEFQLSEDCPLRGADYQLYIEHVDTTGAWDCTDVLEADQDGRVCYEVPLAWTQHGGISTVRLIATAPDQTAYTMKGYLKFDYRDTAKRAERNVVQTLVKDILDRLEKIVDEELSETSENPVQNKAVTIRIQELNKKLESLSMDLTTLKDKGVLVVEYDGKKQVSHTSQQIYDHVRNGGAVTLLEHFESGASGIYNVMQCDAEAAVFAALSDEFELTYIELYGGQVGKSSLNLNHPIVDSELDDRSTNPVQNWVIANELHCLTDAIDVVAGDVKNLEEEMDDLKQNGGGASAEIVDGVLRVVGGKTMAEIKNNVLCVR